MRRAPGAGKMDPGVGGAMDEGKHQSQQQRAERLAWSRALWKAAERGDEELARSLLQAVEDESALREAATEALWAAASHEGSARSLACAQALLRWADPLWDGSAALRRAALGGNDETLRLILGAGEHSPDALRLALAEARRNMREESAKILALAMDAAREKEELARHSSLAQAAARPRL